MIDVGLTLHAAVLKSCERAGLHKNNSYGDLRTVWTAG